MGMGRTVVTDYDTQNDNCGERRCEVIIPPNHQSEARRE